VNPRVLGVIAVAGLVVVGFAIFYVTGGREPRPERASKTAPKDEKDAPPSKPILRKPLKKPMSADEPTEPEGDDEEPPQLTLDDARKEFDLYIADLDREVARLEKSGGTLTQEEWAKLRTRGAAALDSVLRRLDHTDPNMIVEIKAKQEAARTRLDKLGPPAP
jgi:hypothetical protein